MMRSALARLPHSTPGNACRASPQRR